MTIQRRQFICHFCRLPIAQEMLGAKSVAREAKGWLLIRGGVRRQVLGLRLGAGFAHNACVEAAYNKSKVIAGQEEMWPDV